MRDVSDKLFPLKTGKNALEKLISDPEICIFDGAGYPMFKEEKFRLEQVLAWP